MGGGWGEGINILPSSFPSCISLDFFFFFFRVGGGGEGVLVVPVLCWDTWIKHPCSGRGPVQATRSMGKIVIFLTTDRLLVCSPHKQLELM